jgi:hypothetical protein
MIGVNASQNQFGYWYNDTLSFHPGNSLLYVRLYIWKDDGTRFVVTTLVVKIPDSVLDIYHCEDAAADRYNMTDTTSQVATSKAFMEAIAYLLNNRAQDYYLGVSDTSTNLLAGGYLGSALYPAANGVAGAMFTDYVGPSGFSFVARESGSLTSLDAVCTTAGWSARFFLLDNPLSLANTSSGALASGFGSKVVYNPSSYSYYNLLLADKGDESSLDFFAYPFGRPFYVPDIGTNIASLPLSAWRVFLQYFSNLTGMSFASYTEMYLLMSESVGVSGRTYIPGRPASMASSHYYLLSQTVLAGASRTEISSNNPNCNGSSISAILPFDNLNRCKWAEYEHTLKDKVVHLDPNFSNEELDTVIIDAHGKELLPMKSNPIPNYFAYSVGQLPLRDAVLVSQYSEAGVYKDCGARVLAGSSCVNFNTAKSV